MIHFSNVMMLFSSRSEEKLSLFLKLIGGIYEMKDGEGLIDLIKIAGGTTKLQLI